MSQIGCKPVLGVNCIESFWHLLSLANDLELFYATGTFYVAGICSSFLSDHGYVRLVTPARLANKLVNALLLPKVYSMRIISCCRYNQAAQDFTTYK